VSVCDGGCVSYTECADVLFNCITKLSECRKHFRDHDNLSRFHELLMEGNLLKIISRAHEF